MECELLFQRGCPRLRQTRKLISEAIKTLGLELPVKEIEINDLNDAKRRRFSGSPTIRINGNDIEPDTADGIKLACRTYKTAGGMPDKNVLKYMFAHAARRKTILFICTGNSVRSQMAEALVNYHLGSRWVAFSAGIMPMQINQYVVKVMKEIGIDISANTSKHLDVFRNCHFDRIITLCADVDRLCVEYPVARKRDRIIFHDPACAFEFGAGKTSLYRSLRDTIEKKLIKYLAPELPSS